MDVILVSNYQSMMSLPFLLAEEPEFCGMIYGTEPTILFARMLMQEMERTGSESCRTQEWKQKTSDQT